MVVVTDGIARGPEPGGNVGIGSVFIHLTQFAVFDLISQLRAELEIEAFIVDAPAFVGNHVDAIVGIGDQIVERPFSAL